MASDGTDIRIRGYPIKISHPNPKNMRIRIYDNLQTSITKTEISYDFQKKKSKTCWEIQYFLNLRQLYS